MTEAWPALLSALVDVDDAAARAVLVDIAEAASEVPCWVAADCQGLIDCPAGSLPFLGQCVAGVVSYQGWWFRTPCSPQRYCPWLVPGLLHTPALPTCAQPPCSAWTGLRAGRRALRRWRRRLWSCSRPRRSGLHRVTRWPR
jgi:hypothetical protein